MSGIVHIVGLGVSGLSAAVRLAKAGRTLRLYDAAKAAGGRCRSFHDSKLDCLIDNGNHLLLSGNESALSYLDLLGARDELFISDQAQFPFFDYESKERWSVTLDEGIIPFWIFQKSRTIPGVSLSDFLPALKLPFASASATIESITGTKGALYDRFWEPMTWAVLNTTPARASARLMWSVFAETFAKGGRYCKPMIARRGLSETFIDPALSFLKSHDTVTTFNMPLKDISFDNNRAKTLQIGDDGIPLSPDDSVLLALPRAQTARLVPNISVPEGDTAIINAHFKLQDDELTQNAPPLLGLVKAKTHWIFTRGPIISLTISAADALGLDRLPEEILLPQLWEEVIDALNLPYGTTYEAGRLIRERRATFDQSPSSVAKRPAAKTPFDNLFLAGDWTDTGVPATIEGSIRSGEQAAKAILS